MKDLIYGKGSIDRIVNIEVKEDRAIIFRETDKGVVERIERPHSYWILFHKELSPKFQRMDGNLHYKYLMEYDDVKKWREVCRNSRQKNYDNYTVKNTVEQFMLRQGETYYKDMKVGDVSVLAFDIESTGLVHDENARVLLISNTFRKQGAVTKRLFAIDEFDSQKHMLDAWSEWVREIDPSILVGHNVFGFDLPYMSFVAEQAGTKLKLGRDRTNIKFNDYVSQFRKDGSQSYDYKNAHIFGREIVDTFFLSIKYDVQRNYPSYRLKEIIKAEGLEKADRQHYDISNVADMWRTPEEWAKIKKYAEDDADDALALFDLMIPSYFYYSRSIPKTFQAIINSATGTQLNAFMIRSYLQLGHSLPTASQVREYEGAISFGNAGIYKHVYKVDISSLYPSIIRQYHVADKAKDPKEHFLAAVNYFTEERLKNKRLAKETGDRHYKDLEQSEKIVINSMYGFLGSTGLLFNSPENAALVTRKGREILQKGIDWATSKGFVLPNGDTDSISYTTGKKIPNEEFESQIAELNSLFPELIRWEDDGYYKTVVVVKAKNYVLEDEKGKIKIKGSGLKATMKEPRIQDFMSDIIKALLKGNLDHVFPIYNLYCKEASGIADIKPWCFKKTVTKAVLKGERTNETRINDALDGVDVSEGDKVRMFFKTKTELCIEARFDGTYCESTILNKIYNTVKTFDKLIDMRMVPNYSLKKNKYLLQTS